MTRNEQDSIRKIIAETTNVAGNAARRYARLDAFLEGRYQGVLTSSQLSNYTSERRRLESVVASLAPVIVALCVAIDRRGDAHAVLADLSRYVPALRQVSGKVWERD